jgi:hypothetical protein
MGEATQSGKGQKRKGGFVVVKKEEEALAHVVF